ncbi:MAG: serine/threonine transporter SstT [Veillonella caviae]|nr:serine/threonine transporter SstT [Veillonella caviae]
MKYVLQVLNRLSLIQQIIIGLIIGISVALINPTIGKNLSLLGIIFVGALKGIAPVLVFFLVIAAVCRHRAGQQSGMRKIIGMYIVGTFLSAALAVVVSTVFPTTLHLVNATQETAAPEGIAEVLITLLKNAVDNPLHAIMTGNYIGILSWAVVIGFALRHAPDETKEVFANISDAVTTCVQWVIRLAPFGIMGLVAETIATNGIEVLLDYGVLLATLLGSMFFVALVINPIIVFWAIRRNPYPLTLKCLRESGIYAFFTRSSAANIPVNMDLAKRLGVSPDTYSIAIPLGATINMAGAAITITIMTLAAANTLNIQVDFLTSLLLSIIATIGACGASGVAGGSLLLIPLACSLFGISNDIAMQVVGVGFIIGVLQDSTETALNSSTDILFTAAADFAKHGYPSDINHVVIEDTVEQSVQEASLNN